MNAIFRNLNLKKWVGSAAILLAIFPAARALQRDVWEDDIHDFEMMDRKSPPPQNQIVFVGASMIVRWDVKKSFPDLKIINRGFGGSEMADAYHYADRIVIPYKPRIVAVYSGDNDIALGKSPEQVAHDFELLADKIHSALPQTKIIEISVKPSLARWSMVSTQRAANALLKAYCDKHDYIHFLDVSSLTLGADGKPRRELYAWDGLHFNDEGYKLWNAAIRPLLQ